MPNTLEGKDSSLWMETTEPTDYPTLDTNETTTDVVVVGGGITGVVTAYLLQKAGLKTILIEKKRIVEWTTGGTTAKLSSQHYLIYDYLINRHGKETAHAFADANQNGINDIETLGQQLAIDSEFERRSAYIYSSDPAKVADFKAEVEAAKSLGLPASFEAEIDLPYEISGAVKFADQAQFHPRKFLLPLAEQFIKLGGKIYENTKALDITPGSPAGVKTDHGNINASYVVQASGEPFWKNDLFSDFMWLKMSYGLAVTLNNPGDYPSQMYITTDQPMRTIRSAYYQNRPIMIFGGESHQLDENNFDADSHYKNLIDDVRDRYDVDEVKFRWLAGDYMPYDRKPYIGALPDFDNVYVATGYRAWGLAWAMSAARIIVGDITGQPLDWAKHFGLDRLKTPLPEADKIHGI